MDGADQMDERKGRPDGANTPSSPRLWVPRCPDATSCRGGAGADIPVCAPFGALAQSLAGLGCAIRGWKKTVAPLVFSNPRSRRRASQPKSGAASLVFEPEGEAEYSWKSGGLPCRRTGAPRIGAPRVHAPGELGERRFWREAQEEVGGSGACFLLVPFLCTSKEKEPAVGQPPTSSFSNRARSTRYI